MRNFNQDNRSGGRDNRKFNDRKSGRSSMHQAICSDCGRECEVPFRPTGDRPVFCSSCFEKHGNTNPARSGGKNFQKSNFNDKKMFKAVCDKCGRECEVPFRPSGDKPVFCNSCFDKGSNTGNKGPDQIKQQLESLNNKLDKILQILTPFVLQESAPKKEIKKSKASKPLAKAALKKVKAKKKK
ncbi:MAG: hypothetical protein M1338_02635 [Patescibacteria group bacterium]|nr:hypothetical protein [Patescibacteria group bacterium]